MSGKAPVHDSDYKLFDPEISVNATISYSKLISDLRSIKLCSKALCGKLIKRQLCFVWN